MTKVSKLLVVCLTVVIAFALAGCAVNKGSQKDGSDVSSVVSSKITNGDNSGIELPDQDFTSDNQSGESENTTNKEDDANTSSSAQDNNKNEESSSGTAQSSTQDDSSKEDVTPDDEQQDESSDDTISTPSKNEDGSVELPMDKW